MRGIDILRLFMSVKAIVLVAIGNRNQTFDGDGSDIITATYTLDGSGSGWLVTGSPNEYEVKVHQNLGSDTIAGDLKDVWLNLSTTRTWELVCPKFQSRFGDFTVSIRLASTGAVLDTASVQWTMNNGI